MLFSFINLSVQTMGLRNAPFRTTTTRSAPRAPTSRNTSMLNQFCNYFTPAVPTTNSANSSCWPCPPQPCKSFSIEYVSFNKCPCPCPSPTKVFEIVFKTGTEFTGTVNTLYKNSTTNGEWYYYRNVLYNCIGWGTYSITFGNFISPGSEYLLMIEDNNNNYVQAYSGMKCLYELDCFKFSPACKPTKRVVKH